LVQGELGELVDGLSLHRCSLKRSLILTKEEIESIVVMAQFKEGNLLYRATRDGFTASAFHSKCVGKENTVTIIKTDSNYVFGGFTHEKWIIGDGWINDSKAFIFSLRRAGISNSHKLNVKRAQYAIICNSDYVFRFGDDISIKEESDINKGSNTALGVDYDCPPGFSNGSEDTKRFLAGSFTDWLTNEIEVYQINQIN
jgi:hypothetical protein